MIPRPRSVSRFTRLASFAFLVATSAVLGPAVAQAQNGEKYALRFSSKSGDPTPRESMPLRPNVAQDFFIYVENVIDQPAALKVEIRADGKTIDGGSAPATMKAGEKVTQVSFAKPAEKPATPAAPPPAPMPPAFAELKGGLKVLLLDGTNKVLDERTLTVAEPRDYVKVDPEKIIFNPKLGGEKKNQLRVEVTANSETFVGPPCQVELVLDPKRIPGLVDNKKAGTRRRYLTAPGATVVLTAEDLDFTDTKEETGLIYLTVDGWERALTFRWTLPKPGQVTPPTPQQINSPIVRVFAPDKANPGEPLKVKLEADNLGKQWLEVGFDGDGDGDFDKLKGDVVLEFPGNRQQKWSFDPAFPGGALHLKAEVKDWATEIDAAEVFGERNLRVRLLKDAAEAKKQKVEERTVEEMNKGIARDDKGELKLLHLVFLDGNRPAGVKFVKDMPTKLKRGDPLPVSAECAEPKSIKEVVFFVGKLGPDGKIPANAIQAPGELTDKDKGIWSAALDAPTDQKGKFDVTVQFVKVTGLTATDTIKIELVDGKDGTAGGKASIAGKITDAVGAPQGKDITVELRDDKGNVKDTTKTDEKSAYLFKDVAPGTYKITSARTATRTKGDVTVQVKENEKKIDVDVKLSR